MPQVHPEGALMLGDRRLRCALGRGGVVRAACKREGDGTTPAGAWPLRRVLFRPDREAPPTTRLPVQPLRLGDGWCDAPEDPLYNQPVRLPYRGGAEDLWREDALYDLLVVLGHNEPPATPGAGSAIFLHLATQEFTPTRGCVALARADMLDLLGRVGPKDVMTILAPAASA